MTTEITERDTSDTDETVTAACGHNLRPDWDDVPCSLCFKCRGCCGCGHCPVCGAWWDFCSCEEDSR
jgi:hypothetical protein